MLYHPHHRHHHHHYHHYHHYHHSYYFLPHFFFLQIYQRINIRIVFKAIEIWTNGDPYERKSGGGPDLTMFRDYRLSHLIKKFEHDNAQLLR